jgi:hypothetical protein
MNNNYENISLDHFRLKSLRRKERSKRLAFEKKLIKLYQEERAVSKQIWNLGFEELNPPIQRGWKRYFVLQEDTSRSKDVKFFQGILDKINTVQYSWKKDFKVKQRLRGKKIYVVREQELERLSESCVTRKKFTPEEMQYFEVARVPAGKPGEGRWLYTFQEPWRYRLKIEPNIIKWTKIKDFDLERRVNEIRQYLDRNHLRPRMFKIVRGRYQWRLRHHYEGELSKYEYHSLKNRSFADILHEHMPDDQSLIVRFKPSISRAYFFVAIVKKMLTELRIFSYTCYSPNF